MKYFNPRSSVFLFILSIFIVFSGIFLYFYFAYAAKVAPRVFVGEVNVGGMTRDELELFLEKKIGRYVTEGFVFLWNGKQIHIANVAEDSQNLELSHALLEINIDQIADEILRYGNEGAVWQKNFFRFLSLVKGKKVFLSFSFDEDSLRDRLKKEFQGVEIPARDAFLKYDKDTNQFIVQSEESGRALNYEKVFQKIHSLISSLHYEPITLKMAITKPKYSRGDLLPILGKANSILEKFPLLLVYEEKSWQLEGSDIGSWIISETQNENITVHLDSSKASPFFLEIEKEIGVAPKNAKFEMEGNKVKEFQSSTPGKGVDVEATIEKILEETQKNKEEMKDVGIILKDIPSTITSSAENNLGIRELLGVGHSNFKGSPKNRRHNIQVGSEAVHGTLVAPGEEFSLLTVLGEIDGFTGYLPELVIKGNKTIPEYGGGLCQVGTTSFRATMAAGLPVTERRNHSYNVSYYLEDGLPGTDATIYPPHPDFRFLNDTGNYLLFQTRIEGDDLYYEIWGTKDGRLASRTKSEVWDVISPPPTKIIETTDLEPGKKKCTERAHKGAKAKFDYLVRYSDGEEKKQTFYSTYRPWQEVCLLGVEKKEEATEENQEIQETQNPATAQTGAGSTE